MPATAIPAVELAQRYTDAHLAEALVKAAEKHGGAFLLAGNGHVRTDRGVPWYVRQLAPREKMVAVMFLEVEQGKNDPSAYLTRAPDGTAAADYVMFTPRHERPDRENISLDNPLATAERRVAAALDLCRTGQEMIAGQTRDILNATDNESSLWTCYRLKSGALYASAAKCGGCCAAPTTRTPRLCIKRA